MTLAQAAYYTISGTYNGGMGDLVARYPNLTNSNYPAFCAEEAVLTETFARSVADYEWPAYAQAEADAVTTSSAAAVGLYNECARTTGTAALNDVSRRLADVDTTGPANALRLALDLPMI